MALNTVQAILTAFANRLQEGEDLAWSVLLQLSDPTFATTVGDLLAKVGARVVEEPQGRSDADYQAAIRIRVRVNRSRGKAEDIVQIAMLASVNSTPKYYELNDATCVFQVDITNLPGAAQVARLLGQAKPVGVRGLLVYTVDTLDAFTFGDATDATNTITAEQFADAVGNTGPAFPSGALLVSS